MEMRAFLDHVLLNYTQSISLNCMNRKSVRNTFIVFSPGVSFYTDAAFCLRNTPGLHCRHDLNIFTSFWPVKQLQCSEPGLTLKLTLGRLTPPGTL